MENVSDYIHNIPIEEDKVVDKNHDVVQSDGNITNPFSTKDIRITHATIALSSIINRLKHDEIDLNPDFQRNSDLWGRKQMSRLIESILLKLPLPVLYFDVSEPDKWLVVDGLQRLSTFKKFIVDKKLILKDLEFLTHLDGYNYDKLDRNLKRIIDETQIITYQIEAQTPKEVRYSIFNRINTGGLSLNPQEIRQALNQKGGGISFLREVTENNIFKKIVGVSSKRMLDRELALRFVAFKLAGYENFDSNKMKDFLDKAMDKLDLIEDKEEIDKLKNNLLETLTFSEKILGENHRFSRAIADDEKTRTLNRSLFDVITICFSEIKDRDKFFNKKELFLIKFKKLLKDEQGEFLKAITEGTSDKSAIETRFEIMNKLIKEVIYENK
ncbi:MAG: Unknown protein [uncultured Sulfurovum sp.]|uniref:GmrSD restriction endonucleases N-terminal domain-containing protein n=1 Tax=uncultured Sulfurovum sp. TaxID=269237 RepID=A0A6S6U8U2_9BACT|nr:MAG: Unknown protein [uncultured Sulfurovum sp.]